MSESQHPTLGNGKICYLEIPAIDVTESSSFYNEVFGWRIRLRGDGAISFDDAVGEVSGTWITGRSPATDPGIIIYIMVDNAIETLNAIIAHGGKVVQEIGTDYPEITARFSDPAGNVMSIYQAPAKA